MNWYFGNICVRKCPEGVQREHYTLMREIIRGHEDFLITQKMFIAVMREKHHLCGLTDEEFRRPTRDFYRNKRTGI